MLLEERRQPRACSWSAAPGLAAEAAPTKASTVGAALTPGCRIPHPPCPARHTCAAPHRCRVRHTIAVRPRPASPGPAPRRGDTTRRTLLAGAPRAVGRAEGRERVGQYGGVPVGAAYLKKKKK